RQGPRPEEGPAPSPLACEKVIDGPPLAHLHVVRNAMGGEPEDETLDELRVADGQPLRVVTAGRNAHDADRPPPLLANDGGVIVGDLGGGAAGRQVGAAANL